MLLGLVVEFVPRPSIIVSPGLFRSLRIANDTPVTDLLQQALDVIEKCDCEDDEGCGSCTSASAILSTLHFTLMDVSRRQDGVL